MSARVWAGTRYFECELFNACEVNVKLLPIAAHLQRPRRPNSVAVAHNLERYWAPRFLETVIADCHSALQPRVALAIYSPSEAAFVEPESGPSQLVKCDVKSLRSFGWLTLSYWLILGT